MFRLLSTNRLSSWLSVLVIGLMSVVNVSVAAQGAGGSSDSAPAVFTVGLDNQAMYNSIQSAIDAAPVGTIIQIGPGVYRERLQIDKSVTLIGAGWNRTTVVSPVDLAETLAQLRQDMDTRMGRTTSDEQRQALAAEFKAKAQTLADVQTLLVNNARDVAIQGLGISAPGAPEERSSVPVPIVRLRQAQVKMSACAVIDSPGDGIHIVQGSQLDMRACLIAAVWGTGIVVGGREDHTASARIIDCDVRNCHYAGLRICPGCDASTIIQGCRISGAAWHGIRYDDASPKIIGNLIFGNARSGIYASGDSAALVRGNLFFKNEMNGMSCWSKNHDTIEKNTFAGNLREALAVIGPCPVQIRKNIYYDHPKAIIYHTPTSELETEQAGPQFTDNLFWQNRINSERSTRSPGSQEIQTRETKLAEQGNNRVADPQFTDAANADFSLPSGSPAQRAGIGASNPLALQSPWPLQAAELAIIPDSDTRDYRQWKRPKVAARPQPGASGASAGRQARRTDVKLDPAELPNVLLLYHRDSDVRIQTIQTLCTYGGPELIDDLIRAQSVENYTPVHNAYDNGLRTLTGEAQSKRKGQWKAWLAGEVKAGRLQIDYLPLDLNSVAADQRPQILPFATRLGPVHFQEMVSILRTQARDNKKLYPALRYMVANDHNRAVQTFLGTDWLVRVLAQGEVDINIIAYQLNGLADPGPLRDKINAQVLACLDHENNVVVANALHLLAGVHGFAAVFSVPGVEGKVAKLVDHPDKQVALQARRALEKISAPPETQVSAKRPSTRLPSPPKSLVQVSEADRQLPLREVYGQAQQLAQTPDQREQAIAKYLSVLEMHRSNERLYQSALRDLARCYEETGPTETQVRFFADLVFSRPDQGRQEVLGEIFQRFSRKRPELVQAIFAEMRGDAEQKAKPRPVVPSHDLVQGILQRQDKALRQQSLAQLRAMLAPTTPPEQKQVGLATLRASLTAKFDRAPFRDLVLPLLRSDDAQIRHLALFCVPALGGTADDLSLLIPLAEDSSAEVRGQVGAALISLGKGDYPELVIPALTKLLQDDDKQVIERTLRSMWGQYASPEFDALLIELSRDPQHRGHVIYHALSTMHSKSVPVCRRLIEELDESNWNDSGRAAWGLTYGVVEEAKPLVEQGLLAALPEETNDYTRSQGFRALRGVATERSRPYLRSVVDSPMETDKFKELAREILADLDRK